MPITINGSTGLTGVAAIDSVSSTELGYLDGVTSAIQTQLAGKADTSGNGAWTSYSPALSGTGWAIGNGTISGAYTRIGKTIHWRAAITFGSTSTYGASADPVVSLPSTPTGSFQGTSQNNARLVRGSNYQGVIYYTSSGATLQYLGTNGVWTGVRSTAPGTWTSGDAIFLTGTYEES